MDRFVEETNATLRSLQHVVRQNLASLCLLDRRQRAEREQIKENVRFLLDRIESTRFILTWTLEHPSDLALFDARPENELIRV